MINKDKTILPYIENIHINYLKDNNLAVLNIAPPKEINDAFNNVMQSFIQIIGGIKEDINVFAKFVKLCCENISSLIKKQINCYKSILNFLTLLNNS